MARQTSFGDILASARERKGMDLSTAARKLRIRPDILAAIEDGDFARMPPRGYTTNMVSAYARLVGLNPSEMTRAYRDEAHQFETGRRAPGVRMDYPYGRGGFSLDTGRPSSRDDRSRGGRSARSARSGYGGSRSGRTPSSQPQYTNLVQGRQAPGLLANLSSMLPVVVVGAIIVGLLVLVIVLAFGNRAAPDADTPTVPVSGLPTPAGTDTTGQGQNDATGGGASAPAAQPVAPTSAKFVYTVPEDVTVYIEIIQDGKTLEAGNVSGPKTSEYTVTNTLKFVLSGDDDEVAAVKATVDGEEVTPVDQNGRGVFTYTVNFEEVLENWKRANGVTGASSADNPDASGSDETSDGSNSTSDDSQGDDSDPDAASDPEDSSN